MRNDRWRGGDRDVPGVGCRLLPRFTANVLENDGWHGFYWVLGNPPGGGGGEASV